MIGDRDDPFWTTFPEGMVGHTAAEVAAHLDLSWAEADEWFAEHPVAAAQEGWYPGRERQRGEELRKQRGETWY